MSIDTEALLSPPTLAQSLALVVIVTAVAAACIALEFRRIRKANPASATRDTEDRK